MSDDAPRLYDYDAASAFTHYAPETIRRYCDRGILTRGDHFIVRNYRHGRFIRYVRLITPAGIRFLLDRQQRPTNRLYERARVRSETTYRETEQAGHHGQGSQGIPRT
jgi:hypothetical protein